MKLLILLLLLATLSCSIVDHPSGWSENLEAYRDDGSKIDFYLKQSVITDNADTLVIYLQGSDCNSVLQDPFLQNHAKAAWPSADWLLIEKRGITPDLPHTFNAERSDCPNEYIQHDYPSQRVADIELALNRVLRERRYRHVMVLGGSEGAAIAAIFAAQSPDLSAAVLINGGGRYFLDDVRHNIHMTVPAENLEEELNGFNGFAAHILASEAFDLEVSNHGYHWWKEMLTIDHQAVLGAVNIPTLIIQSGRDQSVSPGGVAEMIQSLRAHGKTHFDFVVYPYLDHGLVDVRSISMVDEVISDINRWLEAKLNSP